MGNIPEFTLPSNPKITVRMREATVSDAIDFSGVSDQAEEMATSLFLDRVQNDKGMWSDPKKWTGEDRRFGLYWYWLHTEKDHDVALTFTCGECGKEHTCLVDFKGIADSYKAIQGKPERDFEHEGKSVTVHPLNGEDLEKLEAFRIGFDLAEKKYGYDSGQAKKERTRIRLLEIVYSVRFADEPNENAQDYREKIIEEMTISQFESFAEKVFGAKIEMEHGLECEVSEGKVVILTQPVKCPDAPLEVGTRLRVPFRSIEYIPRIL